MSDFKLSREDAIYITSWGSYNEGNGVGGWYLLSELADLLDDNDDEEREFYNRLIKDGFDIYGQDEELVVHDFDDYTGIGYYEIFGEPYPLTVARFYKKLEDLSDNELGAFIGIKETYSISEALQELDDDNLDDYTVYTEADFDYMLIEFADKTDTRYLDYDAIKEYLEDGIDYDEDGEPEYEIDDYMIEDFIENSSPQYLERFFDFEAYKRDVLMDGNYSEFSFDGNVYYLAD